MYRSLSSIVPNAGDLLALEVGELAVVLLTHLKSYKGESGNGLPERFDQPSEFPQQPEPKGKAAAAGIRRLPARSEQSIGGSVELA
jgi:hypothetical protein